MSHTAHRIAAQRVGDEGQAGVRAFLDRRKAPWAEALIASLLIANRGEIARRIIRTARRLGVRTDRGLFRGRRRRAARAPRPTRRCAIGPPPARESYLNADAILDAAARAGAEAIHPGYGFLSENADFAEAVIAAGLVWVGPPPSAIRAMGLKDAAKRLMAEAGVPVTPGYLGEDQSAGAPGAGGGGDRLAGADQGRGRRRRQGHAQGRRARPSSTRRWPPPAARPPRRSATSGCCWRRSSPARGTSRCRCSATRHGNVVHLFERDCSLQRRHQKVIEEAPAPGLSARRPRDDLRRGRPRGQGGGLRRRGHGGVHRRRLRGLSADRIWFMEMNTRLQVEHPVTEAITGLDLVEWQLRVASGEPLPLTQDRIAMRGHAIEARLYAEDPAKGFLPSTGPLTCFHLPTFGAGRYRAWRPAARSAPGTTR